MPETNAYQESFPPVVAVLTGEDPVRETYSFLVDIDPTKIEGNIAHALVQAVFACCHCDYNLEFHPEASGISRCTGLCPAEEEPEEVINVAHLTVSTKRDNAREFVGKAPCGARLKVAISTHANVYAFSDN